LFNSSLDALGTIKQFLLGSHPRTDVERVLLLAYCLDRFYGRSRFVSTDLTNLNTELGLPRFSNPSFAVRKAKARGLLLQEESKLVLTPAGSNVVKSLERNSI